MSLSPRKELIRIQKRIFRQNQNLIDDSILINEGDFRRYEKNYLKHVKTFERTVKISKLKTALAQVKWIYMGDYHTNRQSQRSLLRILRFMIQDSRPFVLALELLRKHHQVFVDQYLQGRLSKKEFLKKIDLRKHFHFDLWENFEPIFEFAKEHQIPIYGIESAPFGAGLVRRDTAMAKRLAEITRQHPQATILTFVGDLHIAPENLPREVQQVMGSDYERQKELFLYQNSEKIYWQLAQAHLEDKTEIVQIDAKSFCLMNTPPIVWQQSYLNWLAHEEGEVDYLDPKHDFLETVDRIAKFLRIKLPEEKNDVEVFTSGDLSFLERLQEDSKVSRRLERQLTYWVSCGKSFCLSKQAWVYLANMSLNHAAEEATHWIRTLMVGQEPKRSILDYFYARVLYDALGFFGSKIINSKRKCFRLQDFRAMVSLLTKHPAGPKANVEMEAAHFILELKKREKGGLPLADAKSLRRKPELFFEVTEGLGDMLGERLYHALLQGKFKQKEARNLFQHPLAQPGEAWEVYQALVRRYEKVVLPNRM